ncbi:NADP-dependent oxidoreductase [Agromyces sp. NPDC049794]|uniref:NADP-dependent oxidoreductase n=1 Tax=Agromyces sp. NPDC049794 TaxID=3154362 RepID=UPI0033C810D9
MIDRHARGAYSPDVLRLERRAVPAPEDGDLLIEVLYLSIDPTNRNWLKLETANTVREKIGRDLRIGDAMVGEGLGNVLRSRHPDFIEGDVVAGVMEWQETAVVPGARMRHVDVAEDEPLTAHLTIYSHIGMAAMVGLYEIAKIQPGETVLVSAAGGATGRLAVGIAAAHGCRVIGIAGGPDKCTDVLRAGASAAIDYKSEDDLAAGIRAAAPEGVDVYFDGVGGATLDAALSAMSRHGRVAICGVMSDYEEGPHRVGIRNMFLVLIRELKIEGYLAGSHWHRRGDYFAKLRQLLRSGQIEHRIEESVGLESAANQLSKLFTGDNRGKLVVRVGRT